MLDTELESMFTKVFYTDKVFKCSKLEFNQAETYILEQQPSV